jgi:hypothetical protein
VAEDSRDLKRIKEAMGLDAAFDATLRKLMEEDAPRYYVLQGHTPVPVHDVLAWAASFEHKDRIVAQDQIGDYFISTVFLGMNHNWGDGPPVLFETMIFLDDKGDACERYCTWDEAQAGHAAVCERLRESG